MHLTNIRGENLNLKNVTLGTSEVNTLPNSPLCYTRPVHVHQNETFLPSRIPLLVRRELEIDGAY